MTYQMKRMTVKPTHLQRRIACFGLNIKSNNTWILDPDLAEYVNRFIQSFVPTETVAECIIDKNKYGQTE